MANHTNHTRSGCRPGLAQRHPAIAAAFPDSDSQAVGRRAVESLCQGGIPGWRHLGFQGLGFWDDDGDGDGGDDDDEEEEEDELRF